MSGRGVWWEVRWQSGRHIIGWLAYDARPAKTAANIDIVVAKMVVAGEADALAAALECPEDLSFHSAIKYVLREQEKEK